MRFTVGQFPGPPPRPSASADVNAQRDLRDDAAAALALYDEYLSELDKVPTLRDPVLPAELSMQEPDLNEKIRAIVRDELAKINAQSGGGDRERQRKRRRK